MTPLQLLSCLAFVVVTLFGALTALVVFVCRRTIERVDSQDSAMEKLGVSFAVLSKEFDLMGKNVTGSIRAAEIRHEELQRLVDSNDKSIRESTHDIRTMIGTEYATRKELKDSVEGVYAAIREVSKDVGQQFRQVLVDLGLSNNRPL